MQYSPFVCNVSCVSSEASGTDAFSNIQVYNDCNEHVDDARRKSEKSLLYPCFDSGLLAEVTLSVIQQFNIS